MANEKPIATFFGIIASFASAFAFWGSAAFSPSIMLTFVSVPLAICCGIAGAYKSASVALYFGVTAWAPHLVSRGSTFDFGTGWLVLFGAGVLLSVALVCYELFHVRAT